MKKIFAAAIVSGLTLSGCGGGSGGSTQASTTPTQPVITPPDGLYVGTSNAGRTVTGLVLDDGSYYFIYSAPNNPSLIGGAIQGTGTASGGTFTSRNGVDLNLEGNNALATTISASYVAGASLNGTVTYPSQNFSSTFTTTYSKNYEAAPSLAAIAGTYTGLGASTATSEQTSLTVSSSGAITGSSVSSCSLSGSVSPRSKGNAYNASIAFGGPPCLISGGTFTGIAYFDSASKRLYGVVLNSGRTNGFVFNGTKP